MKKILFVNCALAIAIAFAACDSAQPAQQNNSSIVNQWKLGVALRTFHTFDFTTALDKIDS